MSGGEDAGSFCTVDAGTWDSTVGSAIGPVPTPPALSRQTVPSPIAFGMPLCEVPGQHNHCSQASHHALPRSWLSGTYVDVQMALGLAESQSPLSSFLLPFQGSPRTLLNSLITNLSSGGTRCNDRAFLTPFSMRMMCSSVIGALPTQIP